MVYLPVDIAISELPRRPKVHACNSSVRFFLKLRLLTAIGGKLQSRAANLAHFADLPTTPAILTYNQINVAALHSFPLPKPLPALSAKGHAPPSAQFKSFW
jgi:hypothetical protein